MDEKVQSVSRTQPPKPPLTELSKAPPVSSVASFIRSMNLPQGSFLLNELLAQYRATNQAIPTLTQSMHSVMPSGTTSNITTTNKSNSVTLKRKRDELDVSPAWKKYLQSIPNVRFVPKAHSVRAITNLRTRKGTSFRPRQQVNNASNVNSNSSNSNGSSNSSSFSYSEEVLTNSALYNCMHVLKHHFLLYPSLAGFGVFGIDDVYVKFLAYKERNKELLKKKDTKLYFAVLDLDKCYDNVDTKILYDYVVKMFGGTYNQFCSLRRRFSNELNNRKPNWRLTKSSEMDFEVTFVIEPSLKSTEEMVSLTFVLLRCYRRRECGGEV